MKRVIIESPFASNPSLNLTYAHTCVKDCLLRGESPIASHITLTQALDDNVPEQRLLGFRAGWAWYGVAEACVVYEDLGISAGMTEGIKAAEAAGVPVERRELGGIWKHQQARVG